MEDFILSKFNYMTLFFFRNLYEILKTLLIHQGLSFSKLLKLDFENIVRMCVYNQIFFLQMLKI